MITEVLFVIKSGKFYLTRAGGYSSNIDNAMFVSEGYQVLGKELLVKVKYIRSIEELPI